MKHLKFAFISFLCTLFVFYTGGALMCATLDLSKMDTSIRQPLFGVAIAVYCIIIMAYAVNESDK